MMVSIVPNILLRVLFNSNLPIEYLVTLTLFSGFSQYNYASGYGGNYGGPGIPYQNPR